MYKTNKDPMKLDPRTLALIKQRLDEAERNVQYVRHALEEPESVHHDAPDATPQSVGVRVIEGVFDGKNMHGNDGEEYPVPPNYASKSKLVEGDVMKLTIGTDGSFIYKQIRPVDRDRVTGTLVVDEQGKFGVKTDTKTYSVLLASVTFYRAEEGDEVAILIPRHMDGEWGAIENVVHRQQTT